MFTILCIAVIIYLLGVVGTFAYFFRLPWHGDIPTRIFICSCLAIGWPVILAVILKGWCDI